LSTVPKEHQLLKELQTDEKLAKSRRNVLIVSSILVVMTYAGATLTQVHGLIFELTFDSPERLQSILCIASLLLALRYYNHASKYHNTCYERWTSRLCRDNEVLSYDEYASEVVGIAYEIAPDSTSYDDPECSKTCLSFERNWVFNAYFVYETDHEHFIDTRRAYIHKLLRDNKAEYFQMLVLMFRYWMNEQIKEPDSLYLFAPYWLTVIGVYLYLFY